MKLPMRNEVPVELTWDLSLLFPSEEAMLETFEEGMKKADQLVADYKGRLTDARTIDACLTAYDALMADVYNCVNYTDLGASVDYYNSHLQELNSRIGSRYSAASSKLSFIDSEILACDEALIREAIGLNTPNRYYLQDLLAKKAYQLHPDAEKALSALSPALSSPYNIYNMTKLADMKFDNFEVDGKSYPLGYSLYEDNYSYTEDTAVRRAAFDAFCEKLRQYENTTAAVYNANVTSEKLIADLRGYSSVFDYLLQDQHVTREMYDRQIDIITKEFAPHMRKYAKILQKVHGLSEMTFADLKLPLDPSFAPSVTLEKAKQYCKEGLAILGEDYTDMIEEAFTNRWFDLARNQGKSTGGFCATPYRKNSYILLSWNERMSDVLTMAHELGHAGHFKLCGEAQTLSNCNVSSYLVEGPSTMNELLMANYLLDSSEDKRFRRWVLSCMVGGTYYHNFVTHLLEAAYQREVYRIIDQGGSVYAETLNEIYHKVLTDFWDDAVIIPEGAYMTWMRQPHYYMGLYSYTYSAGLTVATQVSRRIRKEGQPAVEDWKKMLAAGSTLDPIGLAALAGIDITNDEALKDTVAYVGSMIDEIGRLTEELMDQ